MNEIPADLHRSGSAVLADRVEAVGSPLPEPAKRVPAGVFEQTVISVRHHTDRLFAFRITRPQSFRFRSGEFVMIGLRVGDKPVFRAYSIASPSWSDTLEFFSIKVPDGPLTSHLQAIRPGDIVLMRPKATGTLVNDALIPGRRLFLLSTGTGIAPFASLIRDPETYEKFERVVLTHTCRDRAELIYGEDAVRAAREDPLVGGEACRRLIHFTSTTRETSPHMGRITTLIESGALFDRLGATPLDPGEDRVMICGSMDMLRDTRAVIAAGGFTEGSNSTPGTYLVERAFVD